MTQLDRLKLSLLLLAIEERRLRGEIPPAAPVSPKQMETIASEIGVPISRQKLTRCISHALQKCRLNPSISAIASNQKNQ